MDGFEQLNDVVSEIGEQISDIVTDVAENVVDFSKETMEHFDETGIQELNKGNWEGALDHSDIEDKEGIKEVARAFCIDDKLLRAGTQIIGGAAGTIIALATPGFQVAGVAAATTCANGIFSLKAALDSNRETKAAAELNEYGATA